MIICFEPYAGTLGKYDQETLLDMIVKAGYDGLDVPASDRFYDYTSEDETRKLRDRLGELGLGVASVCGMPQAHITDPRRQEESVAYWEACIDAAPVFGASSIVIWPPIPEGVYYEDAWDCCLENLSQLLPKSRDAGVELAIEFEKNCLVDNYRDGIRFCEELGEGIALVADTMHIYNDQADPAKCVRAIKDLTAVVHASDSDREVPGRGEFDHETFYATLKEVGYDGPVSLQYRATDLDDMTEACEFVRKMLA